jgi:hypothetical protein
MALDDIVLEPLAKGYNKLPSPLKQVQAILPQHWNFVINTK